MRTEITCYISESRYNSYFRIGKSSTDSNYCKTITKAMYVSYMLYKLALYRLPLLLAFQLIISMYFIYSTLLWMTIRLSMYFCIRISKIYLLGVIECTFVLAVPQTNWNLFRWCYIFFFFHNRNDFWCRRKFMKKMK